MRVLIVKTSSLGDIIHTLPAVTDAMTMYPEISFDWVVEESFQALPAFHPSIHNIIPIALRRWRKQGLCASTFREGLLFIKRLRERHYDCIIDAQGLLKSALLTLVSRGSQRIGLSWKSAREATASLFYSKRVIVPWGPHAVIRARALFAEALGYTLPTTAACYGIEVEPFNAPSLSTPYYVFLHSTTWETKHWPDAYWIELAHKVVNAGYHIQLLWGNDAELVRARKLAHNIPNVHVADKKFELSEVAGILKNAVGIVTVDTGLGHLAAALGVPTISLYGPSDPKQSGTFGASQIHLAATYPCAPCFRRVCLYKGANEAIEPPCFASIPPTKIWKTLTLTERT